MGQLLVPALIGAGVGAVGGAAMGKNPFKTALLGAGVGAAGAGAGLFGAAPTAGVSGLSTAPVAATAGEIAIPTTSLLEGVVAPSVGIPTSALSGGVTNLGVQGIGSGLVPNAGVQLSSNALAGGLDYGINAGNTLAGGQSIYQTPSFMDNISKFPSQVMNYAKENPASLVSNANSLLSMSGNAKAQNQQKLNQAAQIGQTPLISKGNYKASSPLINVSPNIDSMATNGNGLLGMMARIPMTDEERMRLQQLGYRG